MSATSILLLTFASLCAASGQVLFKIGATNRAQWVEFLNSAIFGGLFLYGLGTAIWIYMLSYNRLVNVYAFTALTFVLVSLGGLALDRQSISAVGALGIGLILAGLYLLTAHNN
jgi:drug/metabolite transporter (DMT)-like permease